MRRLRALCAVAALAAALEVGAGDDAWSGSLAGLADMRARAREDNTTALVPEPERAGLDTRTLSVTAVARLQAWRGPVTVAGQLRARGAWGARGRAARLYADELHGEYAVAPQHFLYAGRRHIVHGQSFGVNPLDIALDSLDLDRSKDTNRRRSEIEGQDMLGFESLLGDRFTLAGYWAPGERTVLAGAFTLPAWKFDLTVLLFEDERPGAGLSFSRTLGEAALVYGDIAIRRGRDRKIIRAAAGPGMFIVEEGGGSRLFPQSSIGAGYTLESGATFNLEYLFDANGYSTSEWDEITGLIVENDTGRKNGQGGAQPAGNLLMLNASLSRFTLRRHYGFLRAQHPDLFVHGLAAETTIFHNLADHSGSVGLRLERGVGPNLLLGAEARYLYGEGLDEFALRTARLSGSIYATVNF